MRAMLLMGALLSVAGCGSSKNADEPAGTKCDGDPTSGVCVARVIGSLVDSSGAAVTGAPVSACGDVCYYGVSEGSGAFEVTLDAYIDPSTYHLLVHERTTRASFYYALPTVTEKDVLDAGVALVLTLPESGPALAVSGSGAPAQTVTSGDVTLDVPDGVDVKLDVEDATAGPVGSQFRALTVPDGERSEFIAPELGALALFALAPFEATFRQKGTKTPAKVRVSLTNTTGLPPATPIELLVMGSYYVAQSIPPGSFASVATGSVSADGKSVTLDPGQGTEYLSWLAIREKK